MNQQLLNCIIVEDQIEAQQHLKELIVQHEVLTLIAAFDNIDETISFIDENQVDVIFLDLEVSGRKTGVDLLFMLKHRGNKPAIFICSGVRELIIDAIDYNSLITDYLKKPFSPKKFNTAINNYLEKTTTKMDETNNSAAVETIQTIKEYHFWYNHNHKYGGIDVKVFHKDIAYISVSGNYSTLVLLTGEMILVQMSLKSIEEIIPSCFCYRISRDCLLCNPVCVKKYTRNDRDLLLHKNTRVVVGDSYHRGLRAYVDAYG